jgi:hypothetical protein
VKKAMGLFRNVRSSYLGLGEHLLLLLAFLGTRAALYASGLRFNLDLTWMFLSDLVDLRERLLETVYYFHAFGPGMNLITGMLLKLSPDHLATSAAFVFWMFGGLLSVCLFQILKALGYGRWTAMALALAFSLLPQTLYLENLFLYTYLCASLLCLSAVLFQRALRQKSAFAWLWFFLSCAMLGWLYTVFHLLWFGIMAGIAIALAGRRARRHVIVGLALPALLLVGLYAKNYALFGVFGATSWGGANLTLLTTQQMSVAERREWIREGKLSTYALINAYAPPGDYVRLFPDMHFPWPGSNELTRPSVNEGNFNHGLFLEVNRKRREDAAYFIQARPREYARRVFTQNLPRLFHSTTHWHPYDIYPVAPHDQHRAVLGGYERLYDKVVHSWPVPGMGLYVFLPLFVAWAAWRSLTRLCASDQGTRIPAVLLGFCVFQIAFVVATSSMFTAGETPRYRYTVEPCIWVIVAAALLAAYERVRGLFRPGSRRAWMRGASGQSR